MKKISNYDNWSLIEDKLGEAIYLNSAISKVLFVFESLLDLSLKDIGTVMIKFCESGPRAISKKWEMNNNIDFDFIIELKPTSYNDIRQIIYQISHEINHVILNCNPFPLGHKFSWIYEMLSQLAVLIITKEIIHFAKDSDFNLQEGELLEYHKRLMNCINKKIDLDCFLLLINKNIDKLSEAPYNTDKYDIWTKTYINPLSKCIFKDIEFNINEWKMIKALIDFNYNKPISNKEFFFYWKNIAKERNLPYNFLEKIINSNP